MASLSVSRQLSSRQGPRNEHSINPENEFYEPSVRSNAHSETNGKLNSGWATDSHFTTTLLHSLAGNAHQQPKREESGGGSTTESESDEVHSVKVLISSTNAAAAVTTTINNARRRAASSSLVVVVFAWRAELISKQVLRIQFVFCCEGETNSLCPHISSPNDKTTIKHTPRTNLPCHRFLIRLSSPVPPSNLGFILITHEIFR